MIELEALNGTLLYSLRNHRRLIGIEETRKGVSVYLFGYGGTSCLAPERRTLLYSQGRSSRGKNRSSAIFGSMVTGLACENGIAQSP